MTAALLYEGTHAVLDGLMWQMREIERSASVHAGTPWWAGDIIFANYSHAQVDCVVPFLQFVRDHGKASPYSYGWESPDDLVLQRWVAARG